MGDGNELITINQIGSDGTITHILWKKKKGSKLSALHQKKNGL